MINDLYDELEQIFSIMDEWEDHDDSVDDISIGEIEECFNTHVSQNYE